MKRKFTISVALIFIASLSFAQPAVNSIPNNYAYALHSNQNHLDFLSNSNNKENLDSYTLNEEIKTVNSDAEVFPVLAHFKEKIIIKNLAEPCNILIRDYAGRLIQKLSSTGSSLEINNLNKGNYFVNIVGIRNQEILQ